MHCTGKSSGWKCRCQWQAVVMGEWIGIVVALAVGVPLLVVAVLMDLRRRRAMDTELAAAPERGDDAVDAFVPEYIVQGDVDALARPGTGVEPQRDFADGVRLGFGHLDADFATAGQWAELSDATILMVDDDISTMRELLVPLGGAASGQALVIAAASFHPDVLASLKANRRVTRLPVVAVEANLAELLQLQDEVGGEVLSSADLKAGWVPAHALGAASRWSSDRQYICVAGNRSDKR